MESALALHYTLEMSQANTIIQRPIFLLGATSIVGYNVAARRDAALFPYVTSRSRHATAAQWPRFLLDDADAVARWCAALPAEATVLYCDAVCDVAKCEEKPDWAREINVGNLRRVLAALPADARLVYVSSDHVFGNDGHYDETAVPCPVSKYGAIRAEAERLALAHPGALLIRYGLPIGPSIDGKSGHADWLRYRLRAGLPVTMIEDESRTAMPSVLLADRVIALARSPHTGTRHITANRLMPRVELARALHRHFDLPGDLAISYRHLQPAPHLGRIHIVTRHTDPLAAPLPSPLECLDFIADSLRVSNCVFDNPVYQPHVAKLASQVLV